MATSREIEIAARRRETPATTKETLSGGADALLAMPYAGSPEQEARLAEIIAEERRAAALMVRRLANRHRCSGWCDRPEHALDLAAARTVAAVLGLDGGGE